MQFSGFTYHVQVPCRQPKKQTIVTRPIGELFDLQKKTRWQRLVSCFDIPNYSICVDKVNGVTRNVPGPVLSITLRNGKKLQCGQNQRLLTRSGFKQACELEENESVALIRNKLIWWSSIERIEPAGVLETFSLQMDEGKAYIVEGLIAEQEGNSKQ